MNRRYDSMRVDVYRAAPWEYRALFGVIEVIPFEEDDDTIQPKFVPMRRHAINKWTRNERIKYRCANGRPPVRKIFEVKNDQADATEI